MRAEEARAIAEETKRKEKEWRSRIKDRGEEDARLYAERRFQPVLQGILKRIKKAALNAYSNNEIQIGVEVEVFAETGGLCDGELKNQLLADKIIVVLRGLGYEVEPYLVRGGSRWSDSNSDSNPDYISYTRVNGWIIKW